MKTQTDYVNVDTFDKEIDSKQSEIDSKKTEIKKIKGTIVELEKGLSQLKNERLAEIKKQLQQKFPTLEAICTELVVMENNHESLQKEINDLEKVVGMKDTKGLSELFELFNKKKQQENELHEILNLSYKIRYELCPHTKKTSESYSLPSRDYYWDQCTVCGAKFNEHDSE